MLLSQANTQFLFWLRYGRSNPVTQQSYLTFERNLRIFLARWGDIPVTDINDQKIMELKKYYLDRKCSEKYVYRILCGLKALLKYCHEELKLAVYDRRDIKLPHREDADPEYLTNAEVNCLFSNINMGDIFGLRLAALVALQLETGLRISEALSINREDVDFVTTSIKVKGKGKKIRHVFFKEMSVKRITDYLNARTDNEPALFVNHEHNGSRWNDRCARKHYDSLRGKCNIPKLKSHITRRTFATNLLRNGADVKSIQELLGHATIKYTQRYLGVDWDFIKGVHNTCLDYRLDLTK